MNRVNFGMMAVRNKLRHVLWIGGSPCAGKTSIAKALAPPYHLQTYHFDVLERAHIGRSTQARQPSLQAFLAMTMDQRWVFRSPEEMAEQTIASWTERFELILEDLVACPAARLIVAEGSGFFPDLVAPLLWHPRQAIWLTPTAAFCATMRRQRGSRMPEETSDPQRAWRNLIARDTLLAAHVTHLAKDLGLALFEVDGAQSLAQMTVRVEEQFAPFLAHGET